MTFTCGDEFNIVKEELDKVSNSFEASLEAIEGEIEEHEEKLHNLRGVREELQEGIRLVAEARQATNYAEEFEHLLTM